MDYIKMQCIECKTENTSYWYSKKTKPTCNSCYKKKYHILNKASINKRNSTNYHTKYKTKREEISCAFCKNDFLPKNVLAKSCSTKCADALWRSKNKESIKEDQQYRYHNDIQRRLSVNIRSRVNKALGDSCKAASTTKSLGCSPEELKKHLESKFQGNMSWDNYGMYGWHIDHVVPLAKFDLSDSAQFKAACHYTNLQPLWAKDNLSKGASYER